MTATQHTPDSPDGLQNGIPPAPDVPFRSYSCRFSLAAGGLVNWHWHDEIELCRVKKGRVHCHTSGSRVLLEPNQYLFVNSGVLHMYEPEKGSEDAETETILFHPALIVDPASPLFARYVSPLADCRAIPFFPLGGDGAWLASARSLFDEIYHLDRQRFGWELICRDLVCRLWLLMAESLSPGAQTTASAESALVNDQRAKKMLSFIHQRYHEDLTIDTIAAAASVSRSECFRCFRRSINKKPIEYLTEYRIEQAIGLLRGSDLTITDICYRCGFSSPSYFGKVFRSVTGMPPRSYRHEMERLLKSQPAE